MFRSSNARCTALYCYARSALRWSISGFVGIMTWTSDTLAGTVVTPRRFRVLLRCWPVQPGADSDGDPRGRGCALYADCRYSLVEPSDLDRVFCILYEGQPRVQPRRGGAREPFAGLRVVLPHARISLPARRPRGPGRVRSIPLRSGFHVRPRRPRPRRGGARAPAAAVNAAAAWEFGMGAGSETPAEGRTPLGGDY